MSEPIVKELRDMASQILSKSSVKNTLNKAASMIEDLTITVNRMHEELGDKAMAEMRQSAERFEGLTAYLQKVEKAENGYVFYLNGDDIEAAIRHSILSINPELRMGYAINAAPDTEPFFAVQFRAIRITPLPKYEG